jgi:dihydrofolate reductase
VLKLIYVSNVSLDGYIEDEHGSFDWTAPDDELFAFITDLVRPVGTYLYGRRMYDTMAPWETDPASVRDMKASATSDLTVGGAHLAAHALKAGLVDECHLFIRPVLVGGGKPALPSATRAELELLDDRRLGNGVVYLRYRIPT